MLESIFDKRPLCVALIIWIAFILLFRGYWQQKPKERDGDNLTMVCQVEEITGMNDTVSLVVKDVYEGNTRVCKRMKLYQGSEGTIFSQVRIGQIIRIQGSVYSFPEPGNPGQFNEFDYYQQQGIDYKAFIDHVSVIDQSYQHLQEFLRQLRLRLCQGLYRCCSERDAGILAAMTLGEKGAVDEEVKRLYQENGIAHVLAISGLHISLIGAGIFFFLRKYIMPMHMAVIVSVGLLISYGILTGFPVSTTRAVIMMTCMLGARFVGRHYDAYCALALSAWIQLLIKPLSLFQTGFLLSHGTVLGILVFVKEFEKGWREKALWTPLMAGLGVQLITMPVILATYYELPLYSLVANLMLLPFLGVLLGTALLGECIALWSVPVGQFCMGIVHYILAFYESICHFLESLPCHQIILGCPSLWQILMYYGMLGGWVIYRNFRPEGKRHIILIIGAIGVLCFIPQREPEGLEITNLDVGQGDCACIRTGDITMLIDGGSSDVDEVGKYRISKFLKYKGVRHIDTLFITHSDSDHTNGLLEIITDKGHMGFTIGRVVLPYIQKRDENYQKLIEQCKRGGVSVVSMERGESLRFGDLQIRCLHPYYEYDWKNENDYSLVLEMEYRSFRGLFTGDLEGAGEEEITPLLKPVNYLKVGHHGSKGSSSEDFLAKLEPRIAVYSAGKRNRYGHPSKETKERMEEAGAEEFCTIESGAICVTTDGSEISVSTYR